MQYCCLDNSIVVLFMASSEKQKSITKLTQTKTLEDLIQVRIVRIAELIDQMAKKTTKVVGLSNADLRILNILDGINGVGVNEIARRTHIDKAWVSRSLRALEDKGFISRKKDANDSRIQLILLTKKSRQLIEKIRPGVLMHEKRMLKGVDKKQLIQLLDKVMSNSKELLGDL